LGRLTKKPPLCEACALPAGRKPATPHVEPARL